MAKKVPVKHRSTKEVEITMCYPVKCPKCGKTTWGGCGSHVDSVMRNVPKNQQCTCPQNAAPQGGGSMFSKLFG
ncbi:MAG: hypothetical protein IKZ87_04795 [Actinomycetaceae bacterium]|nr:hypothetical protein [Actinomycetaceae bacterium]